MCVFLKALRLKDWVRFKHTVSISVDDYGDEGTKIAATLKDYGGRGEI